MNKSKKTLLICFLFIVVLGILLYWLLLKPKIDVDSYSRISKSFRSQMKSVDIDNLNVILLTIDTLRADHLECYGYEGVKTPHINQLAEEGILFKHNISQAPLTLPSHSSILTGTFPLYHGIRDNSGFYLDEDHITLAEALKNRGYATAAFVAAFVLDSRWGLDQGFDYYYDNFDLTKYKKASLDAVQRRGDEVLAEAYKWLDTQNQGKFFAWIHLYDPHTPYDPPEPYKTQFKGSRYSLYNGEIAYTDQLIGEFRDFLEKKELMDTTVIIFTSDHGESLGEHKESAHGFFIYDSDIRVPLIIRFPGKAFQGKTIQNQVRSVDIMPTILHILGDESPERVQGTSLLSLILGKDDDSDFSAYSETYWPRYHYGWSELKSLRKGQYKFIDAPKPEFYDVWNDPGEINNLINKKASLVHEFKTELLAFMDTHSREGIEEAGPQKVDNDTLTKLQALGYIGSFQSPTKKGEKLSDPKDKIELYNEIKLAQFLAAEDKTEQAEKKIRDVLIKDESVLEARYILGNILSKQNKYDEAIEEFKTAIEFDPEYYAAIFGLASTYKKAEKTDEAILGFKQLIEMDSKDTKPLLHLGGLYEVRGDLDVALRYLKTGVSLDPESPVFHNLIGAIYLKKNELVLAEKEIKMALSIERSVPLLNAHFNMALLHEARGEFDLAMREYQEEQKTSPFNYLPDFNLGLLYIKSKELDKAIWEFQSAIEKSEEYASAYIFLAKAYMDGEKDLHEAEMYAQKGLGLNPDLKTTIFAHFVLADIYNRLGKQQEAGQYVRKARELQKKLLQ